MQWWYGVVLNSVFFTSFWIFNSKLNLSQQFKVQLIFLPVVLFFNIWVAKSVSMAYNQNVPYFIVNLLAIVVTAIISFILGWLYLKQNISVTQIIGFIIVLFGLVLVNK